jgi:hypothetical protein
MPGLWAFLPVNRRSKERKECLPKFGVRRWLELTQ